MSTGKAPAQILSFERDTMNAAKQYKYETHCHTAPVSACAKASAEETVRFYKALGYDGIFISNHFLDGNISREARKLPYAEQLAYYFRDCEAALAEGKRIGLKVTGKGIAREHQEIMKGDRLVGMTTSGTHCPYIGAPVAMAMVDRELAVIGEKFDVLVRGRKVEAEVVKLPFYRRKKTN